MAGGARAKPRADQPPLATLLAAARSPATRRAYARDWADFTGWCTAQGRVALPASADTVALYLASRATRLRPATLDRRLAAIAVHHRQAGHRLDRGAPLLVEARRGIRRMLGTRPRPKAALTLAELRAMLAALGPGLAGQRDRALLLIGFVGAFRRSELVGLDVEDVEITSAGLRLRLQPGKTDADGPGSWRLLPRSLQADSCPVQALQGWLTGAELRTGPLFRPVDRWGRIGRQRLGDRAVALVVKRTAIAAQHAAGVPAEVAQARAADLAGHSLRSGFVTEAALAGATPWEIMQQTGHRQARSVEAYVRLTAEAGCRSARRLRL